MREVIVALDFENREQTLHFLSKLGDQKPYVKVGMQLFYAQGPEMVRELKKQGFKVFLDLKLHDIPNTVAGGMASLSSLGADIVNLHAAGGVAMMRAALKGVTRADGSRPLVIGVTQLTSTGKQMLNEELGIPGEVADSVALYAKNCKEAGLDGVVCSPLEVPVIKAVCGQKFLCVTPGVRYPDGDVADQVRVTTPQGAAQLGSDFIVVGRPITAAQDPAQAYLKFKSDFTGGK